MKYAMIASLAAALIIPALGAEAKPRHQKQFVKASVYKKKQEQPQTVSFGSFFGFGGIAARARQYVGTNPTGWMRIWCGRFMRMVVPRDPGPAFNLARNWLKIGRRLSAPRVDAIAVMFRRGGGHVGVVSGFDAEGNPKIISGNSRRIKGRRGRVVSERVYPKSRKIIYVAFGG